MNGLPSFAAPQFIGQTKEGVMTSITPTNLVADSNGYNLAATLYCAMEDDV